jgi:hypothetical protein
LGRRLPLALHHEQCHNYKRKTAVKITRRQLRRIIREATEGSDPAMIAREIMRHYDSIASDVGEMYVDDLIDHWYGSDGSASGLLPSGRIKQVAHMARIRKALIDLNDGNVYFGEVDHYGNRDDDGSAGFGSGGAPARFGRR